MSRLLKGNHIPFSHGFGPPGGGGSGIFDSAVFDARLFNETLTDVISGTNKFTLTQGVTPPAYVQRYDSSGNLTHTSPTAAPVFSYELDAATGTRQYYSAKGYGLGTNVVLDNCDLNTANWSLTNATINSSTILAPDGTSTATEIRATTAAGFVEMTSAIGTSASRAFSVMYKRTGGTGLVRYRTTSAGGWNNIGTGTASDWTMVSIGVSNTNHRLGFNGSVAGTTFALYFITLCTNTSTPMFAAKTPGITSLNQANKLSITGANFSSIYSDKNMVYYAEAIHSQGLFLNSFYNIISLYKPVDGTTISIQLRDSPQFRITATSAASSPSISSTYNLPALYPGSGNKIKVAIKNSATEVSFFVNGSKFDSQPPVATIGTTELHLGTFGDNANSSAVARLSIWNANLTDADLIALTSL